MIDLERYCVRCDSTLGFRENTYRGDDWCWVCYEPRQELPARIKAYLIAAEEVVNAAPGK